MILTLAICFSILFCDCACQFNSNYTDINMIKYFKNSLEDYGAEIAKAYLNENLSNLSVNFKKKIELFVNTKIKDLLKDTQEIFSDSSVYTGSAGIGLLLYHRAQSQSQFREAAQYVEGNTSSRRREESPSFLCGAAGPLALGAVLAHRSGQPYTTHAQKLEAMSQVARDPSTPDELLYGRTGLLFALLFVNREIGQNIISPDIISKVVEDILESGRMLAARELVSQEVPLMYRWHGNPYLGGAHGIAGILYLLMQAGAAGVPEVRLTMDWLLRQRYPEGNLPSSLGSCSDRLVQWCHGAPGLVQPAALAHKIYGDEGYLQAALQCGQVVWERGLSTKGYSICHGVSGNAYTFLQLYQTTQNPLWLYRAARFAEWCMEEQDGTELHVPDRPASLFEGLAGRLYFLMDMLRPEEAKFPAYTL